MPGFMHLLRNAVPFLMLLVATLLGLAVQCEWECAIPGGPVVPCHGVECGSCGENGCVCADGHGPK